MVEKYIGKEIAWRDKHGFSYPIWKTPRHKQCSNIENKILNLILLITFPGKKW